MTKQELTKLLDLAERADVEGAAWFDSPKRDFDYVSFGPVEGLKDNNEGPKAAYRFVAAMSPAKVARILRIALGEKP